MEPWLDKLDRSSCEQLIAALELLAETGPPLGRPLVDAVQGSRHRNMKELRPGSSGRSELRVLFAFDSARKAILLVAGDESGNWNKWYRKNIPIADDLFDEHIEKLRGGARWVRAFTTCWPSAPSTARRWRCTRGACSTKCVPTTGVSFASCPSSPRTSSQGG
ncbi:type II toxin-antitoxin system RelE/ParE family toxin [Nocardiopsis akebiae]|uniref:type II toxin-antitoxin system RelE/ParE family toxin n=1 Tax=Nocardiopsis akebiae TaxID=2831968 RepID=UPI00201636EB|nr:type II toxin-antitoxin system RelE/ParE family toxin [Nocardiopsis akebiae]